MCCLYVRVVVMVVMIIVVYSVCVYYVLEFINVIVCLFI